MTDLSKGAWFGDPDLKAATVLRMKQHRVDDEFIQDRYQTLVESINPLEWGLMRSKTTPSGWKGCAVGCLVGEWGLRGNSSFDFPSFHQEVENRFGILEDIAYEIDSIFEAQRGFDAAGDFAVAVVEAIPVGADLGLVDLGCACGYCSDRMEPDKRAQRFIELMEPDKRAQRFIELLASAPLVGEQGGER